MFLVTVTVISFWNKKTKRIYKYKVNNVIIGSIR